MQRVILIFGLLAGTIVSVFMILSIPLWDNGMINFDNGELIGYTTMVIALSMVFFGIKSYRDNYQSGEITFGKGLQVGLLIALVASLMYTVCWEIFYQASPEIRTSFMERYIEHSLDKMKSDGASQNELQLASQEMNNMAEMYKNPLIRFGMTLAEILPVGIVITFLSAGILRKKA